MEISRRWFKKIFLLDCAPLYFCFIYYIEIFIYLIIETPPFRLKNEWNIQVKVTFMYPEHVIITFYAFIEMFKIQNCTESKWYESTVVFIITDYVERSFISLLLSPKIWTCIKIHSLIIICEKISKLFEQIRRVSEVQISFKFHWHNYYVYADIYAFLGNLKFQKSTKYTKHAEMCEIFKIERLLRYLVDEIRFYSSFQHSNCTHKNKDSL